MRTITVFYDNTWYTFSWLKKLYVERQHFKEYGYDLDFRGPTFFFPKSTQFFQPLNSKSDYIKEFSKEYDIVFIAYHQPNGISGFLREDRQECLNLLRRNAKKVIWLDTTDSSGTCLFDVMPFVDKYLKKQLFTDVNNYKRYLYCGRLYTDYYHSHYGMDSDSGETQFDLLPDGYENKLGLSWNVGLSEMFVYDKVKLFLDRNKFREIDMITPRTSRIFDVQFRGSVTDTVFGFQRKKTIELLKKSKYNVVDYSIDPHGREYREEMGKSRIVVSPYNWGEVCYRDFEAFAFGCVLLKPDMSHLRTYPSWYNEDDTYIPFQWDFSDFEENISRVIDNYNDYIQIAENGQRLLYEYRMDQRKRIEFVEHIITEIGE